METQNYATEINEANIGKLVQFFDKGWRLGTLDGFTEDSVRIVRITGHVKFVKREDVRLVIQEPENPKAKEPAQLEKQVAALESAIQETTEQLGSRLRKIATKKKAAKPAKAKATKPAPNRKALPKGFNLMAAFKKARAAMKDQNRKNCKHGHPITAENACVADLIRMGKYCCDPCIKMYAKRQKAKETPNAKSGTMFKMKFSNKPASKKAKAAW